jgi:DNA modification methylase
MNIARSGTSLVVNSKFQELTAKLSDKSADVVVADWPFNKGIIDSSAKKLIADGVKSAARLLKPNGTLISVHYLEPNFHVWKEAEYWDLNLGDSITILRQPIKKVKDKLAHETLSVLVFYGGSLFERTLNSPCRNFGTRNIFSKQVWKCTTDFWGEVRFRNGYWRKASGDNVPEAMPEKYVEKLLKLYSPKEGLIVDLFGGAGTVPAVCNRLGLRCISTEILPHRFEIIQRRLYQTNQELISYSEDLLNKALESIDANEPYTKGDLLWQEHKARVKKEATRRRLVE